MFPLPTRPVGQLHFISKGADPNVVFFQHIGFGTLADEVPDSKVGLDTGLLETLIH